MGKETKGGVLQHYKEQYGSNNIYQVVRSQEINSQVVRQSPGQRGNADKKEQPVRPIFPGPKEYKQRDQDLGYTCDSDDRR